MAQYIVADSPELQKYKKRVLEVARKVRREEKWCFDGFRAALEDLGIELPVPDEPSRGSVVLNPVSSVAYIHTWGGNWRSTSHEEYTNELTWADIWEQCGGDPIILLDTNGYRDYDLLQYKMNSSGKVTVL